MPPTPEKHDLQSTLNQAAGGDPSAWRRLVEQYTPRVFGLLRAQCGEPDLAEEITQSTFCTIAARLGDYHEVGRFESWLFRIAMNRLRDELRRRGRQATPAGDALEGLVGGVEEPGVAADPEDLIALRRVMDELSEADRRVVQLRHLAGMSFAQIAQLEGEPLGTVLARQHRALKKLKQHLEQLGIRAPDKQ